MSVTLADETQALDQLVQLCNTIGSRVDLVQGGGGNASVKIQDGPMLIKASGQALSHVTHHSGIAQVDHRQLRRDIHSLNPQGLNRDDRQKKANAILQEATLNDSTTARPSIETYLHALLSTYTVHSHPLVVIAATSRPDWQEFLQNLFPNFSLCVGYATPGIDLALLLRQGLREVPLVGGSPQIIFLKNHGLIISCSRFDEALDLTYTVNDKLAQALGVDLSPYQRVGECYQLVNNSGLYTQAMHVYHVEDQMINTLVTDPKMIAAPIFTPDTLVYCGYEMVRLNDLVDTSPIQDYINKYQLPPRILVQDNQLFIVCDNIKQARDIESVLKMHLMAYQINKGKVQALDREELDYLSHWEAEQYRQKQ